MAESFHSTRDMRWIGLDIGGANLKLADTLGFARSVPFELWRYPGDLTSTLKRLLAEAPVFDAVAVTMTGELADCYADKREGVLAIAGAASQAGGGRPVEFYTVDGRFASFDAIADDPLAAAAANWHALARFASHYLPRRTGIVIDMGSTTIDIIPIVDGQVATPSRTDLDRLLAGELVYSGLTRTPVSSIVTHLPLRGQSCPVAAELFATSADVHHIRGHLSDGATDNTADGHPLTMVHCQRRLARCVCADDGQLTPDELQTFAVTIDAAQQTQFSRAFEQVTHRYPDCDQQLLISGSGTRVVADWLRRTHFTGTATRLADHLGADQSSSACALAVATLASEEGPP